MLIETIMKKYDVLINPCLPEACTLDLKLKYHVHDMFRYIFKHFLVTKFITFCDSLGNCDVRCNEVSILGVYNFGN